MLTEPGSQISWVVVTGTMKFPSGTGYVAEIHLERPDGTPTVLDARPSDALGLAGRVGAPVFIAETLVQGTDVA